MGLRVAGVSLLDGTAVNFSTSISLVSFRPIGFRKRGPKPAQSPVEPNDSFARFWMRMYSERTSVFSSWAVTAR